jgi:hypothetical protein
MNKSNPELLKAKLQIKRQLAYVTKEYEKALVNAPETAQQFWNGMMEAYSVALQHINGEEV